MLLWWWSPAVAIWDNSGSNKHEQHCGESSNVLGQKGNCGSIRYNIWFEFQISKATRIALVEVTHCHGIWVE